MWFYQSLHPVCFVFRLFTTFVFTYLKRLFAHFSQSLVSGSASYQRREQVLFMESDRELSPETDISFAFPAATVKEHEFNLQPQR